MYFQIETEGRGRSSKFKWLCKNINLGGGSKRADNFVKNTLDDSAAAWKQSCPLSFASSSNVACSHSLLNSEWYETIFIVNFKICVSLYVCKFLSNRQGILHIEQNILWYFLEVLENPLYCYEFRNTIRRKWVACHCSKMPLPEWKAF